MARIKTVGFQAPVDFPLTGKEVKEVMECFWIIPMAVNEPEEYEIWVKHNPIIAMNISKIIKWSQGERDVRTDQEKATAQNQE